MQLHEYRGVAKQSTGVLATRMNTKSHTKTYYPRCAWAATGIVDRWFVCLSVIYEPAHLDAIALRLQHSIYSIDSLHTISIDNGRFRC